MNDGCQLAAKIDAKNQEKLRQFVKPQSAVKISSIFSRFLNYITDILLLWLISDISIGRLLPKEDITPEVIMNNIKLFSLIIIAQYFINFLYYFIFELFFQKTPGKYFTRTKVVMEDGSKPGALSIFIRSLSRLIPFYTISILFNIEGKRWWHDILSKTIVVYDIPDENEILGN